MRRHVLWITLIALGATAVVALRAPAAAPPDLQAAIASQRSLANENPNDPQLLNDLGNLLVLAERMEEAERAYRDAIERSPEMTSARYNLALLLAQTRRPRAALGQLRAVVDAEPDNAWAHYQIGAIHDRLGSDRRAVRHYAAAFRIDPQLAFSEINPHVIENEHVTKAMLRAYRDLPLAAQAPKTYEQPARIVDLLVPAPAAAAPPDALAADPAHAGDRPARSQATWAPGAAEVGGEPENGPPGEGGGRVLREEDLERGGVVNQIVVPGQQSQPRGGQRVPPVRTYTPPGESPSRDQGRPETAPPPPDRQRFVPGIPSTGRLEIELFPVEDRNRQDRAAVAAAG